MSTTAIHPPATVYIPSLEEEEEKEEEAVTRTEKLVGWGTKKREEFHFRFPLKKEICQSRIRAEQKKKFEKVEGLCVHFSEMS